MDHVARVWEQEHVEDEGEEFELDEGGRDRLVAGEQRLGGRASQVLRTAHAQQTFRTLHVLQHATARCSTLQHVAARYNTFDPVTARSTPFDPV